LDELADKATPARGSLDAEHAERLAAAKQHAKPFTQPAAKPDGKHGRKKNTG
jgi:hypothetical protein